MPVDHLALAEAEVAPAILTVRAGHGPGHFIVLWRIHAGLAQIMDPAGGRRWITVESLESEALRLPVPVDPEAWRAWAETETFQRPLARRIRVLGVGSGVARRLAARALEDPTWRGIGALDAATRMLTSIAQRTSLGRSGEVAALLERLAAEPQETSSIPERFWCVWPTTPYEGAERIVFRGAILVHVAGRRTDTRETEAGARLAPELLEALKAPPRTAWAPFRRALAHAGGAVPLLVGGTLAVAAATRKTTRAANAPRRCSPMPSQ